MTEERTVSVFHEFGLVWFIDTDVVPLSPPCTSLRHTPAAWFFSRSPSLLPFTSIFVGRQSVDNTAATIFHLYPHSSAPHTPPRRTTGDAGSHFSAPLMSTPQVGGWLLRYCSARGGVAEVYSQSLSPNTYHTESLCPMQALLSSSPFDEHIVHRLLGGITLKNGAWR